MSREPRHPGPGNGQSAQGKTLIAVGRDLVADHELAARFGAWKQKTLYGRRFMGIERSTFLIDDRGLLQAEWRKVRVAGHAEAVLAALAAR